MAVSWRRVGNIGYVEINSPPVNAAGLDVRCGLSKAVDWAEAETGLERVVLTGAGRVFCAGGDVREFDAAAQKPHLPDVLSRIENCAVPWIAAAHGAAFGGGAELMLACRYRVAAPGTSIGLPEVTLGIVPGAGGSQRLPRTVGLKPALEMITTGKPVKSDVARDIGFLDAIAENPKKHAATVPIADLSGKIPTAKRPAPQYDAAAFETAREAVRKRMRNQTAPLVAIDLIKHSLAGDFAEGLAQERTAFLTLRISDQARALRHIFFAERGARPPDWLRETPPQTIKTVVVVGGGNMGAAIAYALLSTAIRVVLIETDQDGITRARANVDQIIAASLKRGLISDSQAKERAENLTITTDYAACHRADLAIEAAFESMAVKQTVFRALEKALPNHAILATNTSYLNPNDIAAVLKNPSRLIGMHFFAPAHIMKLLEIVRADKTSDTALATGFALAKRLRKIPVLAGVCDGFIGNRILARYREEADILLMDGTTPWDIDAAMQAFGYAMGPYQAQDLSGLDIAYANRQRQKSTRDPACRYIPIADRMVEEGRLGKKSGAGWYRYPGGGGAVIDPLLEDMIIEEAYFAKVKRREFSADEIRTRLLCAMIDEANDLLKEGIAETASDIDLVTVNGYGFPRWRGGLMYYAEQIKP